MNFKQAFEKMKRGIPMKLPSWGGYWCWDEENKTIMMHCREVDSDTGKAVLDIRETQRVEYTLSNVLSDEWIEATRENTTILGGTPTFNFEEALKYLKRGFKLCRKGWNGKGMYVEMEKGGDYKFSEILPFFVIKNTSNSFNTWVPSVSDLMAEDWMFYNEEE